MLMIIEKLIHSETSCLMISLFNCQSECQRVPGSWAFQNIFIHDVNSVFICYIHILKLPWNAYNLFIQIIHEQNYMDSTKFSYSCPFEGECFPFSYLTMVNNWCCYKSIQRQYLAMEIICLLSFLRQTTYETNFYWGN